MQRGIVYKIRRRQDVAQILNGYTTDPRVIDDILLIINLEEAEAQIAGVKCQRRKRHSRKMMQDYYAMILSRSGCGVSGFSAPAFCALVPEALV